MALARMCAFGLRFRQRSRYRNGRSSQLAAVYATLPNLLCLKILQYSQTNDSIVAVGPVRGARRRTTKPASSDYPFGSSTRISVASGPKNTDSRNHSSPLFCFP